MKRYEGLFILSTAGKEEGVKDVIDHITADIAAAGGKVETVQKMDKRPFARAASNKHQAGFYVNYIFQSEPATIAALRTKFRMKEDIFRVVFTEACETAAAAVGQPVA